MTTNSAKIPAGNCSLPTVVGVADCRVARGPHPGLVTYALGSCIAVVVFDPGAQVGGLLHFMLPESSLDQAKAAANPFLFADTGVPILFQEVCRLGAQKQKLRVCIAGGAQIMVESSMFHIGKKNYLALRKILWKSESWCNRKQSEETCPERLLSTWVPARSPFASRESPKRCYLDQA